MESHATPPAAPFSDEEWARLRAEDFAGASAIVTLMVSIFCVGIVLYTIVAWACAS